jgi:hypothetical protein
VVVRRLEHHGWQEPAGKIQLDRDQLFARGRYSIETISYVYKYQLATQVEWIDNRQCFHHHFIYTYLLHATTGSPGFTHVQGGVTLGTGAG